MKKIISLITFVFLFSFSFATEQIASFEATADINADGSVVITEQITVSVEHKEIRRGIIRDLSVEKGEKYRIESLEMDGQNHPYFIERRGKRVEVNFGDDNFLSKGNHVYRLTYTAENVIGFHEKYDEFYWNVTGNDWIFPILNVTFTANLPPGATVIPEGVSVYSGRQGSKGNAAAANAQASATFTYHYTQTLRPGSGLTVSVPFTKKIVFDKYAAQKGALWYKLWMFLVSPLGRFLVALVLLFGMLWYYYWAWKKVGKDPQARVIRQFAPPEGFSASMVRYVNKMKYDNKNFASTLVSLAIKGAIRISEEKQGIGSRYVLDVVDRQIPFLSPEEQAVMNALFSNDTQIILENKNVTKIKNASNRLKEALKTTENKKFFSLNYAWNIPGILLALAITFITMGAGNNLLWGLLFATEIFIFMGILFFVKGRKRWLIIVLTAIILFAPTIILFKETDWFGSLFSISMVIMLLSFVAVPVFWQLLKAYTPQGRALKNEIEGFKEYLSIAEEQRVAQSNPEDEARIFCDYLPYAFALDVESKWVDKFKNKLSSAMFEQTLKNRNVLFVYSSNSKRTFGMFVGAVGHSMVSPSNSNRRSGSFGGGSSGGGRGGGGGRGR